MKQKTENQIVANFHNGISESIPCHFTQKEYARMKGELCFSWNGKPVSEAYARANGFIISDDIEIPNSINSRSKLAHWMTNVLELPRGCPEFTRLYAKFDGLPAGYQRPGEED